VERSGIEEQLDCRLLGQTPVEISVLGAPRDVAEAQFERESALQHPLAGRL